MMKINKNITNTNRSVMSNKKNQYIVVHYVGAVSSAKNNTTYFKNENRGASAHYFVDDNSIWQCVEEKDSAWHCGTKGKYYNKARNNNSIGIEMCCYKNNGKLDISDKTINNTIELVKDIMKRYNIPMENVVRHYDVTHKVCPAPFVENVSRWNDFKSRLIATKIEKPNRTKALQEALNKCGAKLVVDGIIGTKTTNAIKKYYTKSHIIKWVQTNLNELGYNCGKADGISGSKTKTGVKKYQKAKGLTADGIAGVNTIKSICNE